jgi:DNA-binding transcriptional LysR family regulator
VAKNYSRFNVTTLSLIVAVARAGSISAGAQAMNLAVAAASKRLSDFEEQMQIKLFYRRTVGVELTDAGREIYHFVLNVLEHLERREREIAQFAKGVRGQVRVWANPPAISQSLPEDLAQFLNQNSGISLDVEEREGPDIVRAVRENRADIGIFGESMNAAGLAVFPYHKERLGLVVPKKTSIGSKALGAIRSGASIRLYLPAPGNADCVPSRIREQPARSSTQDQIARTQYWHHVSDDFAWTGNRCFAGSGRAGLYQAVELEGDKPDRRLGRSAAASRRARCRLTLSPSSPVV